MATYAYTFTSGDTVTPTKLNNARTVSDIVNADIKSDAAIAGTKIAPDFGSQNAVTTGTVTAAKLFPTGTSSSGNGLYLPATDTLAISTGGSERIRIDASGNIGIGSSSTTTTRVRIDGSFTGSTTSFLYIDPNVAPDMASAVRGCYTVIGTSANAGTPYTTNSLIHFQADQGTFNADSTVPNQYGFYVDSGFIGATNNFGVRLDIPAGTGRWNFYAGGTANNYFAGAIGIGVTSPDAAAALQINSTTQGFLPPRMTTAQRDAITTPPAGLMIYNTSTNKLNVRTASSWEAVTSA
jgi:hypothetical protein